MKQFSELPIVDHDFLLGTDIPAHPPELPAIEIKTNPDIVPASPVIAKSEAKPDITPETAPEPPVIPETKAESVTASVPDQPEPPVKTEAAIQPATALTAVEAPPVPVTKPLRLSEAPIEDHDFPLETDEPVKPETAVQPAAALTAAEAPPVPVIKPLRLSEAPIEDHDFPLETDEPVKTVEPVSISTAKPDTAPEAVVEPPVMPEAKPVTVPAPDTEPAAVPAAPEAEAKPDNTSETAPEPPVVPETKAESVTASVPDQPKPPVKTEAAVQPAAVLTADEAPPLPVIKPFRLSEAPIEDHDFPLETDEPVKTVEPVSTSTAKPDTAPEAVVNAPVMPEAKPVTVPAPDTEPAAVLAAPEAVAKPDIIPETVPESPVIPETKAESVTASVPDQPEPPVKSEDAIQPAAALTAVEAPPVPVTKPFRLSETPIEDHGFPLETDESVKTVEPVSASIAKPDTAPEAVVEPPVVPEAKPVTVHAPDTEPAAVPAAPEAEAKPDNTSETATEPPVIPETKAESVTASVPNQPEPPVKTEDAVQPAAALTAVEAPPVPVTKPFRLSEAPNKDQVFPLETDEPVKPIADASAPKHAMGHGIHKAPQKQTTLDAGSIPKFKNKLVKPPVYMPAHTADGERLFVVDMVQFKQQMLPEGFPATTVWGYGGLTMDPETYCPTYVQSSPGPTFEAIRNVPIKVKWVNKLQGPHLFAVDPTLHWANPNNMPMHPPMPWPDFPPGFPEAQSPVPVVTHLHGGEVPSIFDGHPEAWFTHDGKKGPAFVTNLYNYPNTQPPTTLWYHDHALGITRLNVYAGLAGFYLLRDGDELYNKKYLPKGKYEIPLVIQDRSFNPDGSLAFTTVGVNPDIHPYWDPEFFGDVILVNGKVWPNLDVERRQYRFRVLNGSNARFYNLRFSNGMTFTQIGSDGGFLPEPVKLTSLLLAPAERADLLVDFSGVVPGTHVTLTNDANAPYPDGNPVDPNTTGQILRFSVPAHTPAPVCPPPLPKKLNVIPCLKSNAPQRILTLNEVQGENGPVVVLLNGQHWDAPVSENPIVGSTEEWVIANLTMDTHPIHLHLVQFLLKDRQDFDADGYLKKWTLINGNPPLNHRTYEIPVQKYLIGCPIPPAPNETGWKDTVRMNPMQVTRILVRFAPQDVKTSWPHINRFPFDPSCGPGYVWHCHILDHEDNDMMRPYIVRP